MVHFINGEAALTRRRSKTSSCHSPMVLGLEWENSWLSHPQALLHLVRVNTHPAFWVCPLLSGLCRCPQWAVEGHQMSFSWYFKRVEGLQVHGGAPRVVWSRRVPKSHSFSFIWAVKEVLVGCWVERGVAQEGSCTMLMLRGFVPGWLSQLGLPSAPTAAAAVTQHKDHPKPRTAKPSTASWSWSD